MNTKTTNTAASAKSGKAAAATKGRKQSRLANAETNSIGARALRGRRQQEDEEAFRPVATEMPMGVGGVRTENLERAIQMETSIVRSVKIFGALLQKAGPYLLLEILLPGGTLFALLLFLYKRRQQDGTPNAPRDLHRGASHRQGSRGDRLHREAATTSPRCGAAARASATGSRRSGSRLVSSATGGGSCPTWERRRRIEKRRLRVQSRNR